MARQRDTRGYLRADRLNAIPVFVRDGLGFISEVSPSEAGKPNHTSGKMSSPGRYD